MLTRLLCSVAGRITAGCVITGALLLLTSKTFPHWTMGVAVSVTLAVAVVMTLGGISQTRTQADGACDVGEYPSDLIRID